jgi:integrase
MGSKWFTGGVSARPHGRIQFDFVLEGVRYRPSIRRPPSESNLRRARERLRAIEHQIEVGTFSFSEEFPDYRYLRRLTGAAAVRSCGQVFNEFLAHCESRFAKQDLAAITLSGYRRVLNSVWRPALGTQLFHQVRFSKLARIADAHTWTKKTYNNMISVLRRAFEYGYRDHPEQHNPAAHLRCTRLTKNDRPKIDPFPMQDAETLIAAIHRDWGEAQGNYDEFRFFTGLRPSEQIALAIADLDVVHGVISINKARVAGIDRALTKTGNDRRVELCARALIVLKRQLRLRARLIAAGRIDHDHVFFEETGESIKNLQYPQLRWRRTLAGLRLRYRRPYVARHSSVSWNLMIGKNLLWVSKQHGHSIDTMLRVYATWIEGTSDCDVAAIKRGMARRPARLTRSAESRVSCGPPRRLPQSLSSMQTVRAMRNLGDGRRFWQQIWQHRVVRRAK